MPRSTFLILTLAGVVCALAAVLAFALLRMVSAVRRLSRTDKEGPAETAFMVAAVEEAVKRLRNDERAMKARAEESERVSGEIIASMTSGLLVVGEDRHVRTLNPAGRQILALPEADWSAPIGQVLAGAPALADLIEECLANGKPIMRRAVRLQGGTAAASQLGVTVSPILGTAGVVQGAICLFSDLSQVAELEEQLRLKDSLARLGEMTAGIAHEFRNGLATIHGYARLLDLDRLPPEFRPYVSGIRDETESLRQVVTQFLNFAKPAQLLLAPIDAGMLAERAAEEIAPEARARGGSVTVRGRFGQVDGDEVLLRQALSNVCRNALEACIHAHVVPRIAIDGTPEPAQGMLRISVIDNGPGISDSMATRIFQPFVTTKPNGIGLGLALVQKIVVTHNGRVTAQRESSGGTRIVITLPLRDAAVI